MLTDTGSQLAILMLQLKILLIKPLRHDPHLSTFELSYRLYIHHGTDVISFPKCVNQPVNMVTAK